MVAGDWLFLSGRASTVRAPTWTRLPARTCRAASGTCPPPTPGGRTLVLARSELVRDYELCLDNNHSRTSCQPLGHSIAVQAGTTTLHASMVPALHFSAP